MGLWPRGPVVAAASAAVGHGRAAAAGAALAAQGAAAASRRQGVRPLRTLAGGLGHEDRLGRSSRVAPLAASLLRTQERPSALPAACRGFSDLITEGHDEGGTLRFSFAAACLPHPDKAAKGGEDGYFACPDRHAFGIADGVGGWASNGIDPGEFARGLLKFALEVLNATPKGEEADLQEALMTSMQRLHEVQLQGGSTALLGQLTGNTMSILNLGDSGAILLRPALRTPPGSEKPLLFPRVIFRSSDQTHYFNCPYQLGSGNSPIEAPDFVQVRVRTGDLVVAATDGVFDNLFDHQVQAIVARHLGGAWRSGGPVEPHLQGLATNIAKQAQRIGLQEDQKDVITPFALAAHSEGLNFRGGKLDDTTVVVGLVCNDEGDTGDGEILHNFRD